MRTQLQGIITANNKIAPNAYLLSFPRIFNFLPGQVIGVSISQDTEPRLYSIASGASENEMKLLYKVKPDGVLTPGLSKLKSGDTIYLSEPFGAFVGDEKPAIWIAAGTGIAPFASMLYSGLAGNKKLIHGSRQASGFYFQDDFVMSLKNNYIRCCSGDKQNGFFAGRVTDYLKQLPEIDLTVPYFLCGSTKMVVEVRDILIARGVPFKNIISEIFF